MVITVLIQLDTTAGCPSLSGGYFFISLQDTESYVKVYGKGGGNGCKEGK